MEKSIRKIVEYIAPDGKVFNTEEECLRYEKCMKEDQDYLLMKFKADNLRPDADGEFIPLEMFLINGGSIAKCQKAIKDTPIDYYMLTNIDDAEILANVIAYEYEATASADPDYVLKKLKGVPFPCVVAYAPWYGCGREPMHEKKEIDIVKKWAKSRGLTVKIERKKPKEADDQNTKQETTK